VRTTVGSHRVAPIVQDTGGRGRVDAGRRGAVQPPAGAGPAVVAAFTARLRQTVGLDAVRRDLTGAVYEAFQPTQVSVWVMPAVRTSHAAAAEAGVNSQT